MAKNWLEMVKKQPFWQVGGAVTDRWWIPNFSLKALWFEHSSRISVRANLNYIYHHKNVLQPLYLTFLSSWISKQSERSIFQTFWKPYCCPDFLFLELETSNFSYLLIFWFPLTVQSFRKFGQHWCNIFFKGPPFNVFWLCNLPKIQRGDPYKMSKINVVQYL